MSRRCVLGPGGSDRACGFDGWTSIWCQFSFDYRYDSLPHNILLNWAAELGLHFRILNPLHGMYRGLNALVAVWAHAVGTEVPQASSDANVDDTERTGQSRFRR